MNSESFITTFEDWTLRIRPGMGNRVLFLLHGWTGDENSMSIFTHKLPRDYWIISPRAPYSALPGGYSWRAPAPKGSWPTVDLFKPSIEKLLNLIESWSIANGLDSSSIDMAGFSQGGALTLTFGLFFPQKIRKMGILAGFAPEGSASLMVGGLFAGKKIFVAHGTQDEMVPISMAQMTLTFLKQAGADVIYFESEIGHKLSADGLRAFGEYLSN